MNYIEKIMIKLCRFLLGPCHRCKREIVTANALLLFLYPLYFLVNKILLESKTHVIHVSYSGSPGHITLEYQLSCLLACSNDSKVYLFARRTAVSTGFKDALGSAKNLTSVSFFNSDILYFIAYPLHAFQVSSKLPFSINTCHTPIEICKWKLVGSFYFPAIRLNRLSNEHLINNFKTQLSYVSSNQHCIAEIANKLRIFLCSKNFKHPCLSFSSKKCNIAVIHCRAENHLSNNAVQSPTGEFLSAILHFLRTSGFVTIRFSHPSETEIAIPNDLGEKTPLLHVLDLSFYDQILLAAHSKVALINASGLENLFSLLCIPTIYYGGLFSDLYALNPHAIDIPLRVYDRIKFRFLDLQEIHLLRNSDNNFVCKTALSDLGFSMPTSDQVKAALSNLIMPWSDHDRIASVFISPFGREMIGRRMLNVYLD